MTAIMYVCDWCAESYPEGCGHYDRNELRVMPDGTTLCDGCFNERDSDEYAALEWSKLPAPEPVAALAALGDGK